MIVFVSVFSNEKKTKTLVVPKCPGLSIKNPHLHYVFHLFITRGVIIRFLVKMKVIKKCLVIPGNELLR